MSYPKCITVLLVDDEPSFLSSMQRYLRKEPFRLLTAESGAAALELLKVHDVSIVITDCRMPEMDGLTLLKKIRQEYPHIIPIMLTAVHDLDIAVRAINELGIYKFLLKPVDHESLMNKLRDILAFLDAKNDETIDFQDQLKNRDALLQAFERESPQLSKLDVEELKYFIDKTSYKLILP